MSAETQAIPQSEETQEKWDWKNDETVVFFARLLLIGAMFTGIYLSGRPYEGANSTNTQLNNPSRSLSRELLPGGQIYTVLPGDTLLSICDKFGVPIESVLAANSIENANLIYADQELIIPPAS